MSALDVFSEATRNWFMGSFTAPTAAQDGAWRSVSQGHHTLVVAPTGSGKTLSAFLWSIDRLMDQPPPDPAKRCKVLYISPLKALATDVDRNLRAPLVGISHARQLLGEQTPNIDVMIRTGDTPAAERRRFAKQPPDVLITTPESLFLLLTSAARQSLVGVDTVIIDEIHALAPTKRGAHLALSLERLEELTDVPPQRIGLSATVRPLETVGEFLVGAGRQSTPTRTLQIINPGADKQFDLRVEVPVPDLTDLTTQTPDVSGPAEHQLQAPSLWPHIEERIVDLITQKVNDVKAIEQSTLVFVNSRRTAERLTTRLNEIWAERQGDVNDTPDIARAHHGSVSHDQRNEIETALKMGKIAAVVATSSLELGIDMGSVDLVIQVEPPPSVSAGLQRVGRSGHHVGAVSNGVFFPKQRGDLVPTLVVTQRMSEGLIEHTTIPTNPLDVLAQQLVAICALDQWHVDDLFTLVRRAIPFVSLSRSVFDGVLDMLVGKYPSEQFAELRPRLTWDRVTGTVTGRAGAQRLAVTSGGTIPDRGLYGVFLAGSEGPGRRVGELDEEMVYESRVGDLFTLGTSTWQIVDITHDQVSVRPAPGRTGKPPFWRGDSLGRPVELGIAIGEYFRQVESSGFSSDQAGACDNTALSQWTVDNAFAYIKDQFEATGALPHDKKIVIERFRDELGDWRVVVHSPLGHPVHAPWALAIAGRLQESFGVNVQAQAADDGIVLRLPDIDSDDIDSLLAEAIALDPETARDLVTQEIGKSALFASRFRECAARALLLPRRRPDKRQPLWQQRQRAAQLLEVAAEFPSFPIILETVREVLADVFDVPALVDVLTALRSGETTMVSVTTDQPSPFARTLLFGYVAQFLYEGDAPVAERRAAALSLDPELLAELLGHQDSASLADLLDVDVVQDVSRKLQRLDPQQSARTRDELTDILRVLGPLNKSELYERCSTELGENLDNELKALAKVHRVMKVPVAGQQRWAASEDAGKLRDALGVAPPIGTPSAFTEHVPDAMHQLVMRYARTHVPFTAYDVAQRLGIGVNVATSYLSQAQSSGQLVSGQLLPSALRDNDQSTHQPDWCEPDVLRTLRRRSLASLRADVEPVTAQAFSAFSLNWSGVSSPSSGLGALAKALEHLSGAIIPASALETLILPSRVANYSPSMLDELTTAGEVTWRGHGSLPGDDGWISLHLTHTSDVTLGLWEPTVQVDELTHNAQVVHDALQGGGGYFANGLARNLDLSFHDVFSALWELTWAGHVTNDSFSAMRARLNRGPVRHRRPKTPPRQRFLRTSSTVGANSMSAISPAAGGRWSRLEPEKVSDTLRMAVFSEIILDRYGVVTRGAVSAENIPGGFAAIYKVLAAMEETGRVRRGYFVDHLGAAQFATSVTVDRLRATCDDTDVVLAATDPANVFGAAVPWPPTAHAENHTHRPARRAGALIAIIDGEPAVYAERGAKTMLTFTDDVNVLKRAALTFASLVRSARMSTLTVHTIDGALALEESPLRDALISAGFHLTPRAVRLRR